jgi:hypothetical protein
MSHHVLQLDPVAVIDLAKLPDAVRYEDRYGGYMQIFRDVAYNNVATLIVKNPPASWVPLLKYLRCEVDSPRVCFEHDRMVLKILDEEKFDRTSLEVLCGFRPETTDALWKVDMQWELAPCRRTESENKKEFIVTTNGSFHRPEVLHYLRNVLPRYTPGKRKVVLVPCAADKPYPSVMHQAVLDRMPEGFYLAIATGVLGIVPQDLWGEMPHYDSGLPYEWRLQKVLEEYLIQVPHERIVVYADFYSLAIEQAVKNAYQFLVTSFVNPVRFYEDYLDLLDPERLSQLEKVLLEE